MSTLSTWSPWISPLAEDWAFQLTMKYQIRPGFGVARYLGVNRGYDNDQAVRIWVQRKLESYPNDGTFELFSNLFMALIPSEMFP